VKIDSRNIIKDIMTYKYEEGKEKPLIKMNVSKDKTKIITIKFKYLESSISFLENYKTILNVKRSYLDGKFF
jgi:hypothetical protein